MSAENGNGSLFYVGQKFDTLQELDQVKKEYEDKNFCGLWRKDVRSLEAACKRVPKRVELANMDLKYYSMLLYCKFGGQPRKRKERERETKIFRQGCPFKIYIKLSEDSKALEVSRITEEHNHFISKELYEHFPCQILLSYEVLEEVKVHLN